MGNLSNEKNWATAQRLRYVEACLWWRGWMGRKELMELFGISAAVASADLQRYLELNPGAMVYHTSRKRYEVGLQMRCVLHAPSFEEGLALVLGAEERQNFALPSPLLRHGANLSLHMQGLESPHLGDDDYFEQGSDHARLAVLGLPQRQLNLGVASRLLRALAAQEAVEIFYHSVNSGTSRWRVVMPKAFAHDGRRWHLRAYCAQVEDWRDFVLGRIERVDKNEPSEALTDLWDTLIPAGQSDGDGDGDGEGDEGQGVAPVDEDWQNFEEINLRLNPELSEAQQRAWRLDYGMEGNLLSLRVRRAMKRYLLAELFLLDEEAEQITPPFLLE